MQCKSEPEKRSANPASIYSIYKGAIAFSERNRTPRKTTLYETASKPQDPKRRLISLKQAILEPSET